MNLGERIRYFRDKCRVPSQRLAACLEISEERLGVLERGQEELPAELVPALVRGLGVTYDDFFGTRTLAQDFQVEILIQKIGKLDPPSRREVENFVDFKRGRSDLEARRRQAPRRNVLVVDDDPRVRGTVVTAISELSAHRVFEAQDVDRAIQCLEEQVVDILITDLIMPHTSGLDLIQHTRLVRADLPIIALTGYMDVADANDSLDVDVLMGKPLSLQTLVDEVERLLDASPGPDASV